MAPSRIKKGDTVQSITGREKGKKGKVLKVMIEDNRALVEGLHMVKRHQKPTSKNPEGGVVEKESPINMSNLMLVCKRCKKASRVASKIIEGDKRFRVCRHCGEII